jgi:hypothetical protein
MLLAALAVGSSSTSLFATEPQRVVVELHDGTRLVGTTTAREIRLVTVEGKPAAAEVSRLVELTVGPDREIAVVAVHGAGELRGSGELRGAVETPTIDVQTVAGKLDVPLDQVARIQPVNLKLGLLAHYPLDEDGRDHSGQENHGSLHGGLSFERGRVGQAAAFDGVDDYIEIQPKSEAAKVEDFTVSAWAFVASWKRPLPSTGLDRQYIFDGHTNSATDAWSGRSGPLLCLDGQPGTEYVANLTWVDETNWVETRDAVKLSGSWRLLSFVRRGGTARNYVDGVATATAVFNSSGDASKPIDLRHPWFIGAFSGYNPTYVTPEGCGYGFRGLIDDLRLYDRALNDAELRALFQAGQ